MFEDTQPREIVKSFFFPIHQFWEHNLINRLSLFCKIINIFFDWQRTESVWMKGRTRLHLSNVLWYRALFVDGFESPTFVPQLFLTVAIDRRPIGFRTFCLNRFSSLNTLSDQMLAIRVDVCYNIVRMPWCESSKRDNR